MTRQIDEIVADWVALDSQQEDIKWQRGRLAVEAHQIGQFSELASRTGVERGVLHSYRLTVEAWPTQVPGLCFSVHHELAQAGRGGDYAYAQLLVARGTTGVDAVRAALGRRPSRGEGEVRRGLELLPEDKRADIVKGVLAGNPDLERTVVRESQERAVARMRDAGVRPNRELQHESMSNAALAAVSHMQAAQRGLQDAVRAIRDVGLEDEDRRILQDYHDGAERLLRAFGQALSGDIDAELAALVGQQS